MSVRISIREERDEWLTLGLMALSDMVLAAEGSVVLSSDAVRMYKEFFSFE